MEKNLRLRSNQDYRRVYHRGKNRWNRHFTVVYKKNGRSGTRVGFSITKKYGKAVRRNRIKRQLREVIRRHSERLRPGLDLVIIPKKSTGELEYRELEKALLHVLEKIPL